MEKNYDLHAMNNQSYLMYAMILSILIFFILQ